MGVAAAAVPVAVHFLTRPRPVPVPLSTLRFVREAIRQRRARHRLRDFLVLLLRTLAVLLLAAAVARPQWGQQPLVGEDQEGEAVRVVIVDVSQSMAAIEGNTRAIDIARSKAARFLKGRPGLKTNLILAGAVAEPVFEGPSTNFDALRDALEHCEVLPQAVDVEAALAMAREMLMSIPDDDLRRRELIVVSDFQRSNWTRARFDATWPRQTQVQFEPVATGRPPSNLAVLGAVCYTSAGERQDGQLRIRVGNFSSTPREVTVEATLGEATYRLAGTCPSGETILLTRNVPLEQLGWQTGTAQLVGVEDALAADDSRPLVAQVRPKPVFALITRQQAGQRGSSSHHLEMALVPDGALGEKASVDLRRIDPRDLDPHELAPADLIVLDHPGKLTADSITLLAGALSHGRPMLYVAAEPIDATNLDRLAEAAESLGSGLTMPVRFVPPAAGQTRRNLFINSPQPADGPLAAWGESFSALVGPLRFFGGLDSHPAPNGLAGDVLATYNDGTACLVLALSPTGSLAVLNADLEASNLRWSKAMPLLMETLVEEMLDRGDAERWFESGRPRDVYLPDEIDSVRGLRIVGPAGEENIDAKYGKLETRGSRVAWSWPTPAEPGVYRIAAQRSTVFAAAVNRPAEESDLQRMPEETLTDRQTGELDVYYRDEEGEGDGHDDFWTWLAAACAVCVMGEIVALLGFRT